MRLLVAAALLLATVHAAGQHQPMLSPFDEGPQTAPLADFAPPPVMNSGFQQQPAFLQQQPMQQQAGGWPQMQQQQNMQQFAPVEQFPLPGMMPQQQQQIPQYPMPMEQDQQASMYRPQEQPYGQQFREVQPLPAHSHHAARRRHSDDNIVPIPAEPEPEDAAPRASDEARFRETPKQQSEEFQRLDDAVAAINTDMMSRVQTVKKNDEWVTQVQKILTTYQEKVDRVNKANARLKKEVKSLLKKKKQIQNLKLQKQIQSKLDDANSDLRSLTDAIGSVEDKNHQILKIKAGVSKTVKELTEQIERLKEGDGVDEAAEEEDDSGASFREKSSRLSHGGRGTASSSKVDAAAAPGEREKATLERVRRDLSELEHEQRAKERKERLQNHRP